MLPIGSESVYVFQFYYSSIQQPTDYMLERKETGVLRCLGSCPGNATQLILILTQTAVSSPKILMGNTFKTLTHTLTLILILCCLGCSDDMVSPTLANLGDISELTPDEIEYLTYKQVLTDNMYTSQKLKDAVDSGMFLNRYTLDFTFSWFDFEPRLGGTGASLEPEKEEYAVNFLILVNNIEETTPFGWFDEFAVLHTGRTDHPYFSPPVRGVIIDRETSDVLSNFGFRQEAAENRQDIPLSEFKKNTSLTGKALWEEKSKYFSVICVAPCVFKIPELSFGNWDEKTEIIDALLARSVIRIRLENGMLFDYDFLELFPNPVVIDELSHTNRVNDPR